jgi:SPIRAL1-like protein
MLGCAQTTAKGNNNTLTVDATGTNSLYMGEKPVEGKSNNYARPEGQNVGNFLTDRASSRVLAPPGGASQISFG